MAERLEFNSWGFPAIFVLAARIQWFSYQGRGGAKIIHSVCRQSISEQFHGRKTPVFSLLKRRAALRAFSLELKIKAFRGEAKSSEQLLLKREGHFFDEHKPKSVSKLPVIPRSKTFFKIVKALLPSLPHAKIERPFS